MSASVPKGWRKELLGNLCDVCRGSSPRPIADERYFVGGTIPWIKIADATKSGKYLYETKEHVNEFGASFSRQLPKGSLIIAASGTLGYPQFLGVEGCAHDGWLIPSNFRGIDKHFLYYLFLWKKEFFYSSAYGAAIQNINTMILRDMEVVIPNLTGQERIAAVLSAYDDLIENNTRRIKILEQMAQAIYREWFVNFRFPGHKGVKFVDSSLGKIPQGWQPSVFTDIADILSGGTPSTRIPEYWDGDVPWFTPRDAKGSFYVIDTEKNITQQGVENCASEFYPKDTVFITARGTVGKLALAAVSMAVNQSCYAVRGKPGYGQRFVFLMLRAQIDYLKKNTGGATFDTIITDTFKRMFVMKPQPALADEFEELSEPFFERIRLLHFQNANLRCTRDLLLPKLISGALSVENMEFVA